MGRFFRLLMAGASGLVLALSPAVAPAQNALTRAGSIPKVAAGGGGGGGVTRHGSAYAVFFNVGDTASLPGSAVTGDTCLVGTWNYSGGTSNFKTQGGAGTSLTVVDGARNFADQGVWTTFIFTLSSADAATPTIAIQDDAGTETAAEIVCYSGLAGVATQGDFKKGSSVASLDTLSYTPQSGSKLAVAFTMGLQTGAYTLTNPGSWTAVNNPQNIGGNWDGSVWEFMNYTGTSAHWATFPATHFAAVAVIDVK